MGAVKYRSGILFRDNPRAGIGAGTVPVVDSGTPGAASLSHAPFHDDGLGSILSGTYGGVASSDTTTDNKGIRSNLIHLAIAYGVWPLRNRRIPLNVLMPSSYLCILPL